MVLEATIIVVDNSESSRNGDYVPSRFQAQGDAINLIFSAKIQSNPESSVGLMSMGGSGPEVLTTLTTDMGKIMEGLHRTKIRGSPHFSTGVNIATLALKHRQNKSQRQRIIVFTCSALSEDEKSLVKLAKRMKKNNINIDIVAFGDLTPENIKKLEAFNENVKGGDGSHLAIIHPSSNLLSDAIVTTPILGGDAAPSGGAGSGSGGGAQGGEGGEGGAQDWEFGVDPSTDPELALALRMSYEEEKARQQRESKGQETSGGKSELEGITEEAGGENKPLLDKSGEPNSPGSNSKDQTEKKDKDDADRMDTA